MSKAYPEPVGRDLMTEKGQQPGLTEKEAAGLWGFCHKNKIHKLPEISSPTSNKHKPNASRSSQSKQDELYYRNNQISHF